MRRRGRAGSLRGVAPGRDSAAQRALGVPRLVVAGRRVHDPARQVEVRLLRAVPGPAGALRPGKRSGGAA